jgi:hypothetical protein
MPPFTVSPAVALKGGDFSLWSQSRDISPVDAAERLITTMGETIRIKPTSRHTAVMNPIVVRDKVTTRLVFLADIHDNPKDPKACVSGTFVYQRKGINDKWEDERTIDLTNLKKGEGVSWHLSSAELLHFLREIFGVYRVYKKEKIPLFDAEYTQVTEPLRELIKLGETGLFAQLETEPAQAKKLVELVLSWVLSSGDKKARLDWLADLNQFRSDELNIIVRLAALRRLIELWDRNEENNQEEFWQKELGNCPYAFSLIFPYAVVLVAEKAYMGGKDISNTGGNTADFIVKRALTGNCLVVEIKNPKTPLLGGIYRNHVYSVSHELSGATVQTQNCIQNLIAEEFKLLSNSDNAHATRPRGLILAGHSAQLNDENRRRSFELYRNGLEGLEVLTFDEFFQKAKMLVDILRLGTE